jgi:DNA-binding GntR family transcriptional regulator
MLLAQGDNTYYGRRHKYCHLALVKLSQNAIFTHILRRLYKFTGTILRVLLILLRLSHSTDSTDSTNFAPILRILQNLFMPARCQVVIDANEMHARY